MLSALPLAEGCERLELIRSDSCIFPKGPVHNPDLVNGKPAGLWNLATNGNQNLRAHFRRSPPLPAAHVQLANNSLHLLRVLCQCSPQPRTRGKAIQQLPIKVKTATSQRAVPENLDGWFGACACSLLNAFFCQATPALHHGAT